MNCTSFREVVHEMDRDGLLDGSAYDAAVAHAQICRRCARLLFQLRQLDASLKALVRADFHCGTSARAHGQLLRAFREQVPAGRYRQRAIGWLSAAAAVLILAGAVFLMRRRAPAPGLAARSTPVSVLAAEPAAPASHAASGSGAAALKPESPGAGKLLAAASPARARGRKRVHKANAAAGSDQFEDLADFIPLPYTDDDSPLGAGEMVRVRLAQSTLGLLGFPVREDRASEPVTADLVIGQDGVARAIRFVSGPAPVELVQLQATTSYNRGVKQP